MDPNDGELDDLYREVDAILQRDNTPDLGAPVSEPSRWTPLDGWGTIRDYVVVRNDSGGTDLGCRFIPDDGSQPVPLMWRNVVPDSPALKGVSEFARGIMTGNGSDRNLSIKVTKKLMEDAEGMVSQINAADTLKRAMTERADPFFRKCGYGRDSAWRLVKAAPGLLRA